MPTQDDVVYLRTIAPDAMAQIERARRGSASDINDIRNMLLRVARSGSVLLVARVAEMIFQDAMAQAERHCQRHAQAERN